MHCRRGVSRFSLHLPHSSYTWVQVAGGDVTPQLARGYWPSYNVPYWPEVYERSGYGTMKKTHGNYFSYELCPRATIFRRDAHSVEADGPDLTSIKKILRYNNYLKDPLSKDFTTGQPNPMYAICSRGDLRNPGPSAGGCYDTKVTSHLHGFWKRTASVINGPTRGGLSDLAPFSWDAAPFAKMVHAGLPETYQFAFQETSPAQLPVPPPAEEGSLGE